MTRRIYSDFLDESKLIYYVRGMYELLVRYGVDSYGRRLSRSSLPTYRRENVDNDTNF